MKNTIKLEMVTDRKRWLQHVGTRLVRIYSGQWQSWWSPNRNGYTDCVTGAGLYLFADALHASGHCGSEKRIEYEFLPVDTPLKPTQEARGPAKLLLQKVAA